MDHKLFKGIFTALITPFSEDGREIDLKALAELVEWQIQQGIHGLVPCGTTGESPVLSDDEYKQVITTCIDAARGRVPIIAGAGSNNTAKSVAMAEYAASKKADGILVVAPYYNKPTQNGMYAHFTAVAEAAQLPTILYNIPGRSIVNIEAETLRQLAEHPLISGIKDSTGDLSRPTETRLLCGDEFCQFSGEDAVIPGFLAQGGDGAISVSANVAPRLYADLYDAWQKGDLPVFQQLRDILHPLTKAMFIETSPAPVKYALHLRGLCSPSLRLPLLPCSDISRPIIDATIDHLKGYEPVHKAHADEKATHYGS